MTLNEIRNEAKGKMGYCNSCEICDGKACTNMMPGPGAKGSGVVAIENFNAWKEIKLNMDTISDSGDITTTTEIFGKKLSIPVFVGPISNVQKNYSKLYKEHEFADIIVGRSKDAGICAFTGDSNDTNVMDAGLNAIKNNDGFGIPTIKPWDKNKVNEILLKVKEAKAFAVAMDIDGVGLKGLDYSKGLAATKNENDLHEIVNSLDVPFIVKGIMTVKGAKKAIDAGAKGIVVSNHGGRVLDGTPATANVLKEISDFAKGKCKIFVDGGIRNGIDVFKAIALGADATIIARPFVQVVFGDKENGIKTYVDSLINELKETMNMCGARKITDIDFDMVRVG